MRHPVVGVLILALTAAPATMWGAAGTAGATAEVSAGGAARTAGATAEALAGVAGAVPGATVEAAAGVAGAVPGATAEVAARVAGAAPGAPDAQAVLRAIEDNHRGGSGRFTIVLTVVRPGRQTEYVLETWTDGDERALAVVKAPARDAGQAFLRVGDNLWIYNPRLKRSLRLPPSGRTESFLGSDISYSDLAGRDAEQDYTPRILGEDAGAVTLELLPKPGAPTPYGKLIIKAQSATYAPLELTFYDQRGGAVKRITLSEHIKVGPRLFPTRTVVDDLLRTGYRTIGVFRETRFGAPVPDRCFTLQALEQGCE